ncbi:hypothetical protein [Cellulomonas sp. KRMCY2]|uniref:hypothetical protein n=1 Tax=Cellulomonas sp. KRMCY2 TaxID=1304865 RepID=UPI00045E6260|nr:hypothetical protein [Cellulomonas sp. KRMCY2]
MAGGFPAADASPADVFTSSWAPENQESGYVPDPGEIQVRTEGDAVRIVHTSMDGRSTTTTCTKE